MTTHILLLLVGFVLLVKGADLLVGGASSLAKRLSMPDMTIGLTVVAFGTSAPELAVNLAGSLSGQNDVVLGNILGSNLFNTLFILGAVALIRPLTIRRDTVWREIPFALAAGVILAVLATGSTGNRGGAMGLSRMEGMVLLGGFAGFVTYTFLIARVRTSNDPEVRSLTSAKTALFIVAGLLGLFMGGRLVVDHAVEIAHLLNWSEKTIAVTILATGTSLPELLTSAVAAARRKSDIAVGNVLGSNIFNILFVLGLSVTIRPLAFPPSYLLETGLYTAASLLLFGAMFTGERLKLDRWEAGLFLCAYLLYLLFGLR